MLDLPARDAEGHGPVHLLLTSATEIGFAWDGSEQGWIRAALPPLTMLSGRVQHFQKAILEAWQLKVGAQLAERQGFRSAQFLDLRRSLQLLNSSHLREREKMPLRSILCGGVWKGFTLGKAERRRYCAAFVGREMVMVLFLGSVPFHPFCILGISLRFPPFWLEVLAFAWMAAWT